MKFQTLLATAAAIPSKLAAAHDTMIAELDCIDVKTGTDLAYVDRRIPIMALTFVPPQHRDAVAEAMNRLSQRIADAGHLKKQDRDVAKTIVAKAISTLRSQPEKMATPGNGHAEGMSAGVFTGDQPRTQHGSHRSQRS